MSVDIISNIWTKASRPSPQPGRYFLTLPGSVGNPFSFHELTGQNADVL